MKKVVIKKAYELVVEDADKPQISENQFLVKTLFTGISAGTELMWYKGTNPGLISGRCAYPAQVGYEHVGEVVEIGKSIDKTLLEQKIFSLSPHQEYVVMDSDKDYCVLPERIRPEECLCTSLTATALHTVHRSGISIGDSVAIVGLGVLGQLIGQVAKSAGASRVIGIDLVDSKLEKALELGFDNVINPKKIELDKAVNSITGSYGVDIAIEAAGNSAAVQSACEVCRKSGKVTVAGFQSKPFQISGEIFWSKELTIKAVRAAGPLWATKNKLNHVRDDLYEYIRWDCHENFKEAFRLVAVGKVKGASLITHKFKIDDIEKAYKMIDSGKEEFLHVILEW
ncbi:MAG: Oxidoreductase domain protein [Candidatus Uhrbacteria bacterium GW2011_GWF2_39_13]|uniref:Oxidoreductase domain protein n=1 Tax=Candidatus Uhrbacteria bacterium GW2011_GWF2_39_13 TaxID=1618995 RepID=A0A0G0Q0P3_9BACT|nr:MAG: Oxidoreductase domain protein [Candidatus Uhrbacteria bacterium GW2011_GWF2_39_13]